MKASENDPIKEKMMQLLQKRRGENVKTNSEVNTKSIKNASQQNVRNSRKIHRRKSGSV